MTKLEFINNIRPCKECKSKRNVYPEFKIDENMQMNVTIRCRCGNKVEGNDPIHVLANWNAKNLDKTKTYCVIIQHKINFFDVAVYRYQVESISEISLDIEKKHPDYEILSIKEIVT